MHFLKLLVSQNCITKLCLRLCMPTSLLILALYIAALKTVVRFLCCIFHDIVHKIYFLYVIIYNKFVTVLENVTATMSEWWRIWDLGYQISNTIILQLHLSAAITVDCGLSSVDSCYKYQLLQSFYLSKNAFAQPF